MAVYGHTAWLNGDTLYMPVAVAYPQLVSGGVSEIHKSKWLVKVGVNGRV